MNENVSIWPDGVSDHNYHQYLSTFMKSLKAIIDEHGFRLVAYNPNELLGTNLSQGGQYYSFFDIVLSRDSN